MTELTLLNSFLLVAFVLAPRMTNQFFLGESNLYSGAHKISLMVLLVGELLRWNGLFIAWPLFCGFGFLLYLKKNRDSSLSVRGIAECIPFVFSLIASVWFFAGGNDLHLLNYNRTWSFYATLHGSFLGWMFVGCLAILSKRNCATKIYLGGCYLSLIFFLMVAFGIDGIAYIKRVGVVGFSLMVPFFIARYAFNLKKENRRSLFLAGLSLASILLSMTLAVFNEFWLGIPKVAYGIPVMVLIHGSLNALIAMPCFFLAIYFEPNQPQAKVSDGYRAAKRILREK